MPARDLVLEGTIMLKMLTLAAVLSLAAAGGADAKSCHDANGKFVKCPAAAEKATTKAAPAAKAKTTAKTTAKAETTTAPKTSAAAKSSTSKTTTAQTTASAGGGGGLLDALRGRNRSAAPAATSAGRTASATAPAGSPTAKCKDGTLSYSQHRSGTCAGHGGVASWY
jgi:hypothetical protein